MMPQNPDGYWDEVYSAKGEAGVSWFQENPSQSLALITATGAPKTAGVIDIGGGASRLVDALIGEGFTDLSVLDLSASALASAQARLGPAAALVDWIVADATEWRPPRQYDVWHDRAAFHFLTEAGQRRGYVAALTQALKPAGHVIIATFAPDGPQRCSGLPVVRYDGAALQAELGSLFSLLRTIRHTHLTPSGAAQSFQFSLFCKA